jgi:hypothetical protein
MNADSGIERVILISIIIWDLIYRPVMATGDPRQISPPKRIPQRRVGILAENKSSEMQCGAFPEIVFDVVQVTTGS